MIEAYLVDSITLKQDPVKDKWGTITTPATSRTVRGRVNYKIREVQDEGGRTLRSTASVILEKKYSQDARSAIGHDDRIRFDGTDWGVIAVHKHKDFQDRMIEVFVE